MSNICVGELATQAERQRGPPSAVQQGGKTPVSCDPPAPAAPAPCALPCHGGPVPAPPPSLPNIWSGRVQSTESRGDHLEAIPKPTGFAHPPKSSALVVSDGQCQQ